MARSLASKSGLAIGALRLSGMSMATGFRRRRTSTVSPPATHESTVDVACFNSRIVVDFIRDTMM
jgi:hypothetical protein